MKHLPWILIAAGVILYLAENPSTASAIPGTATLNTLATNVENVLPLPFSLGTTLILVGGGIYAYRRFK